MHSNANIQKQNQCKHKWHQHDSSSSQKLRTCNGRTRSSSIITYGINVCTIHRIAYRNPRTIIALVIFSILTSVATYILKTCRIPHKLKLPSRSVQGNWPKWLRQLPHEGINIITKLNRSLLYDADIWK